MNRFAAAGMWLAIAIVAGAAPGALAAGDAIEGKALAERWCSSCHLVAPDQATANADVPSFAVIAAKDFDADHFAALLADPHPPMPSLNLSQAEIRNLLAYIETLRPGE